MVFAVWGHESKDTPSSSRPEGQIPELAKALMEGNEIPLTQHHTVCSQDDDGRLMSALDQCILEVHLKNRPKSDSVLTPPDMIKLGDSLNSLSDSSSEARRLAGQIEVDMHLDSRRRKRKCCKI